MEQFKRSLVTTSKQIRRSGWLAWASVSVMTLAFLVTTVFGFIGYSLNLFLQSVENKPQIYAFFEVGTNEATINQIKDQWSLVKGVDHIEYTSEDQAKQEFYGNQKGINDLAAQAVQDRKLPASLAIRLTSLDYATQVNQIILDTQNNHSEIKTISYSKDIVDNIRELFTWIRIGGGIIIVLLLIVIILFTLLTVEFRTYSRAEEIEIMQLVGGGLGYIRLPFILEGAFYGSIGALISNLIISVLAAVVIYQLKTNQLNYIKSLLGQLYWPHVTTVEIVLLFFAIILIGGLLGGLNSYIAIRRYIK